MAMSPKVAALIAKAKEEHAKKLAAQALQNASAPQRLEISKPSAAAYPVAINGKLHEERTHAVLTKSGSFHPSLPGIDLNDRQTEAVELAMRAKSFCMIGAAGTGKTTTEREIIAQVCRMPHVSMISKSTEWLSAGTPGVVIISFTNKAVNNIKKFLDPVLQNHCMTYHKLLEYRPVFYEEEGEDGEMKKTMQFEPTYHALNFLPHISVVIVEESSMVGTDLHQKLLDALPNPEQTQFIFLGDLNQLPPIFGPSILGFKLAELQVVELTHVYRQALLSPIIDIAHKIRTGLGWYHNKTNKLGTDVIIDDRGEHGKVTIIPWKKRIDKDVARNTLLIKYLIPLITSQEYDFENTMILCPFNKSFGTILLNKAIADALGKKRGATIFEVIARYQRTYWAVGDRVLVDRREAIITKIEPTPGYNGPIPSSPSPYMDRNGNIKREGIVIETGHPDDEKKLPNGGIDVLDSLELGSVESGKNLASHTITVFFTETATELAISSAGGINSMLFSYVLTVHKSQGSEARKVIVLLHYSHNSMLSRELLYTAVTRARHELVILCEPDRGEIYNSLSKAAKSPEIEGVTLQEKIAFFTKKAKEYRKLVEESEDSEEMDDA